MRMLRLCMPGEHSAGSIFPGRQADEPGAEGACMPTLTTAVIEVRTSPHFHAERSVDAIMRQVVFALRPICGYAVWLFGISALALMVTPTITCLVTEEIGCRISGRRSSTGDYSAVITGLLLALTLPPGLPLWMAAVGGFIAIAPGK